jgi:hypothetical protein
LPPLPLKKFFRKVTVRVVPAFPADRLGLTPHPPLDSIR